MEQFNVTGMSCAACSARVEKAVSQVPGVTSCSVSLLTNSMGVEFAAPATAEKICQPCRVGNGGRVPAFQHSIQLRRAGNTVCLQPGNF